MKKLNLYSKSNIERNHLIDTITGKVDGSTPFFFILALAIYIIPLFLYIGLPDGTTPTHKFLITSLANQTVQTPSSDLTYIFGISSIQYMFATLLGIVSVLPLLHLLFKASATYQLSVGIKRKRLFSTLTFAPLSVAIVCVITVNIFLLLLNLRYVGYSAVLVPAFMAHLMYTISCILWGAMCLAVTIILARRWVEALACFLGLLTFPLIKFLITSIFDVTLNGFDIHNRYVSNINTDLFNFNEITYYIDYVMPPSLAAYVSGYINLLTTARTTEPLNDSFFILISSTIWCGIIFAILCLLSKYFEKKYKFEEYRQKGKSKAALIIACTSITLYRIALLILKFALNDNTTNQFDNPIEEILIILLTIFAISLPLSWIVSLKIKRNYTGLISAGICIVLCIAITVIGLTGAFGFEEWIPETKEIESVTIRPYFKMCSDNRSVPFQLSISNLNSYYKLTTQDDIELCREIHKAYINSDKKEFSGNCTITYTLKNGKNINRTYEFVSEDVVNTALKLWESDYVKEQYAQLLQITKPQYDVTGDATSSRILQFNNLHIISKYNKATNITNSVTKEQTDELRRALYKDICTLSAEEWFAPEHQYGVLAISNDKGKGGLIDDALPITTFNGEEYDQWYFFVNSNMTNTVNVLKKYDYFKFFDSAKQIKSALTVEIEDLTIWTLDSFKTSYFSSDYKKPHLVDARTRDGKTLHTTYLMWNNSLTEKYIKVCLLNNTTDYDSLNPYAQPPITTVVTPTEATKLVNDGYLGYNVGDEGKVLILFYSDGTYNTVIIPDK